MEPQPEQPTEKPVIEGEPVTEPVAEVLPVEGDGEPEPYSVGEAWERFKESGRRFRKAVLYPAARMFKDYVDNSLDAADELADGFKGKKKRDR